MLESGSCSNVPTVTILQGLHREANRGCWWRESKIYHSQQPCSNVSRQQWHWSIIYCWYEEIRVYFSCILCSIGYLVYHIFGGKFLSLWLMKALSNFLEKRPSIVNYYTISLLWCGSVYVIKNFKKKIVSLYVSNRQSFTVCHIKIVKKKKKKSCVIVCDLEPLIFLIMYMSFPSLKNYFSKR